MYASLAIKILLILLSSLLGLWLGWCIHTFTWWLRTRHRSLIVVLGLLGAGFSAVLLAQLFSPYLSIPLAWKIAVPGVVLVLIIALVILHTRRQQVRWWADLAAQFANLMLVILLVFLSVIGRDAWITGVYPRYGEKALDLISTMQSWLAVLLVTGLLAAELYHPKGGLYGKYHS